MKSCIKRYWFLAGIGLAVALAYVLPDAGIFLGGHHAKGAAVVTIFLMSGLTTGLRQVRDDVKNWRCHVLVQGFSFLVIPAVLVWTSGWLRDDALRYGIWLVAVLPTTISSCVVLTTAAGGRTSCALLNAVGGNLLGIIVSPLLLGFLVGHGNALDGALALRTMAALCRIVLLPFALGRIAGLAFPSLATRVNRFQSYAAQGCILLIMFCAFAASLGSLTESLGAVWPCFAYLAAAHVLFVVAAGGGARLFRLPADVSASAVFCAGQKTLALGLPLADSFFAEMDVPLAVVILPIIFYHLFQLAFASSLVSYWAKRTRASAAVVP